jgi:hypothetical protein
MKKILLSLIAGILLYTVSSGQGIFRGKITDENGDPVTGANVVMKSQPTVGTMSDFNGQFSLKISSTNPEVIIISFVSYKTIEDSINPKAGEIIIKDYSLVPVSKMITEAVVVAKSNRSKENYMETVKAKSVLSLDFISSETIKRTGDVSVSSAVARVSGVSTNGSFITVRGIGDRYMKTAINGSQIPTLDPFSNNINLDLFPASLVDNIVITKTASPDLPGDWAGAYLSIETKDYPEKLTINVESSFGYNQQTTFKDIVSSQRSSTDWLGFDNGLRDINHNDFVPINPTPSTYDEFVALGLGDYFKSLGVTKSNWNQGTPKDVADTYFKLGLEQLGLLGKAEFNNNNAFQNAVALYNSSDKQRAFDLMNANGIKEQNKLFPDNWNTIRRKAPLNFSQSFSIGNQITLFGKPLGYLFGFRYSSSTRFDPNATAHTYYKKNNNLSLDCDTTTQNASIETNGWSALLNLSYKYNPNHSISFMFMPNIIGINKDQDGYVDYNGTGTDDLPHVHRQVQYYEERKQLVYQLKSEHFIPGPKMKIELDASYTQGKSSDPDFKLYMPGTVEDDRYFRYLSENLLDSRLSAEIPLGSVTNAGIKKVKFGVSYQFNDRKNDQYDYVFFKKNQSILTTAIDSNLNRYYLEYGYPINHSFGHSDIKGGFLMVDYPINPFLRFSGGLRIEESNMYTDISLFDSLGLSSTDVRRKYDPNKPPALPGALNKISYLPSANLIIKLKQDDLAPINLRLSYSQTVARPNLREISDVRVYDYELKSNVQGNPDLKMVQINNYDVRLEAYFESGDNISVSAFYKEFKNHIELINHGTGLDGPGARWINSPDIAWLKGIEIEGRKTIFKQLEIRANLTIVDSRATINTSFVQDNGLPVKGDTVSHTMYGQAPYIVNAMLAYNSDKMGIAATLSYNVQGPRLVIIGQHGAAYIPDIYEMPRNLLDFKMSKSIGNHFSVSLKILDILNTPVRRAYKFPEGYILDYDKYTWGTTWVFSLLYKL